jgi:8-hydroxy-5-deazaflavin:NADPH oxidoreductase
MKHKVGILGSGIVGQTLANGFKDHGYDVSVGSRSGRAVENWRGSTGTFTEVAAQAGLIVLAVKGSAAEGIIDSIKLDLVGKTIIDTTNPLSDQPPDDGVVRYFTGPNESLMERLQAIAPEAYFVKAFNSIGNALMINPKYEDGLPTMFICGNESVAKVEVAEILSKFGWDVADMGGVKSARAIEPLCMLWCIPGLLQNQWTHAFKLLRK